MKQEESSIAFICAICEICGSVVSSSACFATFAVQSVPPHAALHAAGVVKAADNVERGDRIL
jgi:hypothetical protein